MRRIKILSCLVLLFSVTVFVISFWQQTEFQDNEGPVIQMDSDRIEVSIHDPEEVLLEGVTAEDARDGDVTGSLVVESLSEFMDSKERIVNYAAFDSNNHVTKAFRRLVYTDYTPIRLTMEAPLRFPMTSNYSSTNILSDIEATDCLDGDISEKITVSADSSVMMDVASEYPITIQVSNSVGDTVELPVTVTIYDQSVENSSPKFTLTDYLVYTTTNNPLDPRDYVEAVSCKSGSYEPTEGTGTYGVDTSGMSNEERTSFMAQDPAISWGYIDVTDSVDYAVPGVYEIKYSMTDEDGNTGSIYLVVVVEEE